MLCFKYTELLNHGPHIFLPTTYLSYFHHLVLRLVTSVTQKVNKNCYLDKRVSGPPKIRLGWWIKSLVWKKFVLYTPRWQFPAKCIKEHGKRAENNNSNRNIPSNPCRVVAFHRCIVPTYFPHWEVADDWSWIAFQRASSEILAKVRLEPVMWKVEKNDSFKYCADPWCVRFESIPLHLLPRMS